MPFVLSYKAHQGWFIENEEFLSEILGHSNFDGYPWSVGDLIVFENGTVATIEMEKGEKFYTWSSPQQNTPITVMEQIISVCGNRSIHLGIDCSWSSLFAYFESVRVVGSKKSWWRFWQ